MTTFEEIFCDRIWNKNLLEKSNFKCSRINEAIKMLNNGNRLLDVGCGEGTFLNLAKKNYNYVFGIDLSIEALKSACRKNFTVIKNNINNEGIPFHKETFDAVTCLDVIEHIYDPVWLLSEIYRVLKRNGLVILSTPNVRFIEFVSKILLKGRFPKTSDDLHTYNGGHINYFTFRDIKNLLSNVGFKILEDKGIAYRPYRTFKIRIFRAVMKLWEKEIEKEFFSKGIIVKAQKN